MTPPTLPRWLTLVIAATTLIFIGHVAYRYTGGFVAWVESDAAVPMLMAENVLRTGNPVPTNWYFGNGDVWLLSSHLIALLPVALLGVGTRSCAVALCFGIGLETAALVWAYRRLANGRVWVALFAALLTLMAWSQFHVLYVYMQPSYGFHATVQAVTFAAFASSIAPSASPESAAWRLGKGGAGLVGVSVLFLVAASNPTRGLVFLLGPIAVACAWPWAGVTRLHKARILALAAFGWTTGFLVYRFVFLRVCSFTPWPSHAAFAVRDGAGILTNLRTLGRGMLTLAGARYYERSPSLGDLASPPVVLGLVLLVGALVLVGRHVLSSRALTPLRFAAVVVSVQLVGTSLPVAIGNLVEAPYSVRYVMTSLLLVFGLAGILSIEALQAAAASWRRSATVWIVLVPLVAMVAVLRLDGRSPAPARAEWPDVPEHMRLADELKRRNLSHGFSDLWNANIQTLVSRGAARTCPVFFGHVLMPQRWHVEDTCYDARLLPERFYVITYPDAAAEGASARKAIAVDPVETFSVGPSYLVSVFRTAEARLAWLDLPLADGDRMSFPFRLPASHIAFIQAKAAVEGGRLVATGEEGFIVYGPYLSLPKGKFRIQWLGSGIESAGDVTFAVTMKYGEVKLSEARVAVPGGSAPPRSVLVSSVIELPEGGAGVEFRAYSNGGAKVVLDELLIEKL